MNRFILIGTLFVLFLLEGTLFQVFSPGLWGSSFVIMPHLVLSVIVMLALFTGSTQGLLYGFAFGLIHDIVYGDVIGLYAYGMGFVGYFAGQMKRMFNNNIFLVVVTIIVSNLVFDSLVYGLQYLFSLTSAPYRWVFFYQIIPSILFNMAFSVLVYHPIRSLLSKLSIKVEEQE